MRSKFELMSLKLMLLKAYSVIDRTMKQTITIFVPVLRFDIALGVDLSLKAIYKAFLAF